MFFLSSLRLMLVVPRGNAPRSSAYQAGALLLSYETVLSHSHMENVAEGVGNAPTSAMPILFSRQVQPAFICLPSAKLIPALNHFLALALCRREEAGRLRARSGLRLGEANGASGRTPTCIP